MLYTNEAIRKRQILNKKIRKNIRIITCIILIPLLIYNVSLIIQSVVNPRKTPNFFGIKTYVIISGSMEPNLKIGDVVIVKSSDTIDYKEGDIISFRQGQIIVTHRIVKIENQGKLVYKTKGDNNNSEDNEEVTANLIEGKLIFKIPWVGNIALLLQGKISIIVLLIVYYIIASRINKIEKRKNERRKKRIEFEDNN